MKVARHKKYITCNSIYKAEEQLNFSYSIRNKKDFNLRVRRESLLEKLMRIIYGMVEIFLSCFGDWLYSYIKLMKLFKLHLFILCYFILC